MKIAIGTVLALALTLAGVPAFADDTFQAFSTLPAAEQVTLTPLLDDQLAAIEGASSYGDLTQICTVCTNTQAAVVTQANAALASIAVKQENESSVRQSQRINTVD
jgi:hypothetical protein